jgi:hypothetical protein
VSDRLIDYHREPRPRRLRGHQRHRTAGHNLQPRGRRPVDVLFGRNRRRAQALGRGRERPTTVGCSPNAGPRPRPPREGRVAAPIGASSLPDDLSWTVPQLLSTRGSRR